MDDDLTDDEIENIVQQAVSELLNIAAGVADLQLTDEAAEDIYMLCDLVAEYHAIDRVDSSTSADEHTQESPTRTEPIPGSIRTKNKPKLRVVDYAARPKPKPKPKQ